MHLRHGLRERISFDDDTRLRDVEQRLQEHYRDSIREYVTRSTTELLPDGPIPLDFYPGAPTVGAEPKPLDPDLRVADLPAAETEGVYWWPRSKVPVPPPKETTSTFGGGTRDPRLHSLRLEGQPRRDQFRAARQALQAACGSSTLAADPPTLEVRGDQTGLKEVRLGERQFTFYLKDGTNVYPLHFGMNSIGRLPDNDVVIRDECISRRHCAVVIHSDLRCELHDVASKSGTLLNGKKIPAPTRLQSGDQITLCNRRLTFHLVEIASDQAVQAAGGSPAPVGEPKVGEGEAEIGASTVHPDGR
jgi:hypothetical protein